MIAPLLLALAFQPAPPAPPAPVTGPAGGYSRSITNDMLEFTYEWPAAAEQEPVLSALLHQRLDEAFTTATRYANEDKASRGGEVPFNVHLYGEGWEVAGETGQLMSLTSAVSTYTGGAHGNMHFGAILWDKGADHALDMDSALGGDGLRALSPRYCDALDAEREARRGEPVRRGPDELFGDCPDIGEQVVAPVDADDNGRFDTLRVLLPPYAAGPYVEGDYVIDVRLGADDIARIDARYRPSFEVGTAITTRPDG